MPVEIRELVIQARLQDNIAEEINLAPDIPEQEVDANAPDPEWMEQVINQCIIRMKEWITEKSMR